MSRPPRQPTKSALDFALGKHNEANNRDTLELTHALVSTCWTQQMLDTAGKNPEEIAALSLAYASIIQMLEVKLGQGFSAVPTQSTRVQRVAAIPTTAS